LVRLLLSSAHPLRVDIADGTTGRQSRLAGYSTPISVKKNQVLLARILDQTRQRESGEVGKERLPARGEGCAMIRALQVERRKNKT
jgi:hypothetical protein